MDINDLIYRVISQKKSDPHLGTLSFQELASYFNPLSREEERRYLTIILLEDSTQEQKDYAMGVLVLHNLRFIIKEANKQKFTAFDKSIQHQHEILDDLILAGIQGLIVAIEKFDITRDNRLLSYASHWIKQHIIKVSQHTSVYPENYDELDDLDKTSIHQNELIYIDSEDENRKEMAHEILTNIIEEILKKLDPIEQKIVIDYYGLNNVTPKNIDEIGASLRSSRERVRQILNKAQNKIMRIINENNKYEKITELLNIL